jgi:hypothetical protein
MQARVQEGRRVSYSIMEVVLTGYMVLTSKFGYYIR